MLKWMMILALCSTVTAQVVPVAWAIPADTIWVAGPQEVAQGEWVVIIGDIPLHRQGANDAIKVFRWWVDEVTGLNRSEHIWANDLSQPFTQEGGAIRVGTRIVAWFRAPVNPPLADGGLVPEVGLQIWYAGHGLTASLFRTNGPKVCVSPINPVDGFVGAVQGALAAFYWAAAGLNDVAGGG